MGIESFLVASALRGVVAQRLVRKLCPACKKEYPVDETVWEGNLFQNRSCRDRNEDDIDLHKSYTLFRQEGCEACRHSGYLGRMAILHRASEKELWEAAKAEFPGLVSLEEDGMCKVRKGVTSVQELLRVLGV